MEVNQAYYRISFEVNEEEKWVNVKGSDTLLYVLREELGLVGAKPGCLNGDCGACTVLVNGCPMKSCILLAVEVSQQKVTTIEGLKNTPIQEAFVGYWGFQCGYCTSGFIMNCQGLVTLKPDASDAVIEEWLDSNICRCTGYEEIEAAVKSVLRCNDYSLTDLKRIPNTMT